MGLTSALNTALNGLSLNETTIDVLGNNIANAGTNGFKASRTLFSTQLARTLSVGSAPTNTNGGTNPRQIGLGALNSSIQVDFTQGSITNSTSPSDLAIQGDGFFIVRSTEGDVYTRNGSFGLNSESNLTNAQGLKLQGYGVTDNFELVTTTLQDITIPLGNLQVASATSTASLKGALYSSGTIASQGTLLESEAMVNGVAAPITGATLLSDVRTAALPGTTLYNVGDEIVLAPKKGGADLPVHRLLVTATTTVADFLDRLDQALGLQSGGAVPTDADSIAVGTSVTAGGVIRIKGNRGTVNDIDIPVDGLTVNNGVRDMGFQGVSRADGQSTSTQFVVYDSLGQSVNVKLNATLESITATTTTFRYFVESVDDSDGDLAVMNGTVTFDNHGRFLEAPNAEFAVDRADTAAVSPLQIDLDWSNVSGISTNSAGSTLALGNQDGSSPGTLTSFVIDEQGKINGVFDNGVIKTLGQLVLARFANPQGLLQGGSDTYRSGVASGLPILATPGAFGSGTVRAGAIELSNTDIGRNLVDLIVASTNYRGSARVLSSVQQLVDELLVLGGR